MKISRWVFIVCSVSLVAGRAAAEADLAPRFVPDTPNLDLVEGDCPSPARLLGFDVLTGGTKATLDVPEFMVGFPTTVTVQLIPRVVPVDEPADLIVRMKGSGPEVSFRSPLNMAAWAPGVRARAELIVQVPRFTHAGDGVLTLAIGCGGEEGQEVPLYRGPSFTHQIVTTSKAPLPGLESVFGKAIQPLRASFRLGDGARVPVRVKETVTRPVVGIGVVSALAHDIAFQQGAPIASIRVYGQDGEETQELFLRAGVDTSLTEYDIARPGTYSLDKGEVANQKRHPGDRLTWNRRPLKLFKYAARLPLARPMRPKRLEVTYLTDIGVLDVSEIVLLFDEAALERRDEA